MKDNKEQSKEVFREEVILVEVLFDQEEDTELEELGIKTISDSKNFEIVPRYIFTDKILAFGPATYTGVSTVHMVDGFAFRVKCTPDILLKKIYGMDEEEKTEDDFII